MAQRPRAFERAEEDARRGDLGSARRRLQSFVHSTGYHPEAIQEIARLSVRMGDPYEAGRWYALIDSADAEAAASMETFRQRCGGWAGASGRVPLMGGKLRAEDLPAAVRERLNEVGQRRVGVPAAQRGVPHQLRGIAWASRARLVLKAIVLLFVGTAICVGVLTIAGWVKQRL